MWRIVDPAGMREALKPRHRLFGLDLGTRTIGMAICDPGLTIATPFHTIRRTRFTLDVEEMARMAQKEGVGGLVIGLPINMDDTEGPRAQSARAFARNLKGKLDLPILFQDERLSTVAAEEAMIAAGVHREMRRQNIDAAAASFILTAALEAIARTAAPGERS